MKQAKRYLLSGDEAVAQGALDAGVHLGSGYPGTPSTEILEHLAEIGGPAQWSPNEKVAYEVALGVAYSGGQALVTMKHVGVNVAADPLFTSAYTGVSGGLVVVSADDPGMASSQNEQDNRRYAEAAGVCMLEPSDSQEAYDFTLAAFELSRKWKLPIILRITTRICHSQTVVYRRGNLPVPPQPHYERDLTNRVMVPAYARGAHVRLREHLAKVKDWNETSTLNVIVEGDRKLGIITSGVCFAHAKEAAPEASFLKLGMTYPLPIDKVREFTKSVDRCVVIEEGDPYLVDAFRAAGIKVEGKPEMYRFGELNVSRVRRILAGDESPEPVPPRGKPPALCQGCPHRKAFESLRDLNCIVSGDIGCYTLGVLAPFEAMDTCVCMGASIGVGLGMRHTLPEEQARRVVSVIGDSTFMHSGLTGLVEMVYNPPPTGHVVLILDNGTTAMTGLQEHPGTGRKLNHEPTATVSMEDVSRAIGIERVEVIDPRKSDTDFEKVLKGALDAQEPAVLIARAPCILSAKKLRQLEAEAKANNEQLECEPAKE
jgi:indolepyruvate ferredoxin oxidoreductase alpha subunit